MKRPVTRILVRCLLAAVLCACGKSSSDVTLDPGMARMGRAPMEVVDVTGTVRNGGSPVNGSVERDGGIGSDMRSLSVVDSGVDSGVDPGIDSGAPQSLDGASSGFDGAGVTGGDVRGLGPDMPGTFDVSLTVTDMFVGTSDTGLTSDVSPAVPTHGLKATYYDNVDFQGAPKAIRYEPLVGTFWGKPPAPLSPDAEYAVRWTGKITPTESKIYGFISLSYDSRRVTIDGKLVYSNWRTPPPGITGGSESTIALEAGRAYNFIEEATRVKVNGVFSGPPKLTLDYSPDRGVSWPAIPTEWLTP